MRSSSWISFFLTLCAGFSLPGRALPQDYVIHGAITAVDDPGGQLDPAIQVGSPFALTIVVDPSLAQTATEIPGLGVWAHSGTGLLSGELQVEGQSYSVEPDRVAIGAGVPVDGGTADVWGSTLSASGELRASFLLQDPSLTMIGNPMFFVVPDVGRYLEGLGVTLSAVNVQLAEGSRRGDPLDLDLDGFPNNVDVCPRYPSQDQTDTDGNGIGDDCECGDFNGDATVNIADILDISSFLFGSADPPPLCDGNLDFSCNVTDILTANLKIFGIEIFCERYPENTTEACLADCQAILDDAEATCETSFDPASCGGDPICENQLQALRNACIGAAQSDFVDCQAGC